MNETIHSEEPVDLSTVASLAWEGIGPADATLEVTAARTLRADRDRLQELFEELFRNAIEYAGTDVTVQVGVPENGTGFYVADDGPGIAESNREAVLKPGYAGQDGNIGLGLGFVRRIAENHGLEITVTEIESGGARFEFSGVELCR